MSDRRGDAACWAFGPPDREILVGNAERLLAHLPVFLAGWPFRRVGDGGQRDAAIEVVDRDDGRIVVVAGGTDAAFGDEFAAAEGLAAALVATFTARDRALVGLRAAGVQVGQGLVLLLGEPQAGKSSVALQMASAGYRLFGADRLALRLAAEAPAVGLCLGLTAKVRLPLPPDCGPRFAEYVDSFTEIRGDGVAYLKLWEGEAATFMEEAPLTALVVLDRVQAGACRLTPMTPPDVTKKLIGSCVAPPTESADPAALASRIAGYALRFSSSRDAAAALVDALRDRPIAAARADHA